jgi:hypothetical protein
MDRGGDPRASAQNNLVIEFLGDYVYASALGGYGVAVWNDVRDGDVCADVNTWRAGVQTSLSLAGRPAVQQDCTGGEATSEHGHLRLDGRAVGHSLGR